MPTAIEATAATAPTEDEDTGPAFTVTGTRVGLGPALGALRDTEYTAPTVDAFEYNGTTMRVTRGRSLGVFDS